MNTSAFDDEPLEQPLETIATDYKPPASKDSRWVFDYEELYWQIKAQLLGGWLTIDKNGVYVIKKPQSAIAFMNSKGIENTMAIVNAFTNKIQGVSFFTDEQRIYQLMFELNEKLILFFYVNMDSFDLPPEKASIVIRLIVDQCEANMRKSIGGLSIKIIGNTEKIIETRVEEKPMKKGWF